MNSNTVTFKANNINKSSSPPFYNEDKKIIIKSNLNGLFINDDLSNLNELLKIIDNTETNVETKTSSPNPQLSYINEFNSSNTITSPDLLKVIDNTEASVETKAQRPTPQLSYIDRFNSSNKHTSPEITFDELDKHDFKNKAFIEVIKSPEFVHLYFDRT